MGLLFSCSPQPVERQSSIDTLTDDEVYALIQARSKEKTVGLPTDWNPLIIDTVWRITHDAVVKRTNTPTEAFIMSYISSHTSIPIPKIRRVLPDTHPRTTWIVMDYIEGDVLQSAWRTMSWWRRLSIVWFIRCYIRQLQKTTLPNPRVPGPFDASGKSYPCIGYYFTEDGAGPFDSYSEMAAWFDRRRFDTQVAQHSDYGVLLSCPKFDTSHPLVLCHMDLHMRNIIVDRNGTPWIVDWANAGAFPPWLEYAHMVLWGKAAREETCAPKSWIWFARFIIGDYERYMTDYLNKLEWALQRPALDFPLDYFDKLGLKVD
ncbi:kinase-like domain-containing protein [Flammula alnicola]|nr:kinase-like domain-containing protein [Flammula alnicola]